MHQLRGRTSENHTFAMQKIMTMLSVLARLIISGHIRYSSQVSICTSFITGTCQLGSKCENHHCPLPYHWQYRLSLEGWKSFSTEDNSKIEELFCDPKNDIVNTSEIELTVKTYSRER